MDGTPLGNRIIKVNHAGEFGAINIYRAQHAIELCGKAMLRSLGHLPNDIRKKHKYHKLLELLGDVENEISSHSDSKVHGFRDFLLHTPTIDGQEFGNTIGSYLKKHFNQGKTAFPRNYLYPDNGMFTGPKPFSAIYVIAEHLIERAKSLASVLGYEAS